MSQRCDVTALLRKPNCKHSLIWGEVDRESLNPETKPSWRSFNTVLDGVRRHCFKTLWLKVEIITQLCHQQSRERSENLKVEINCVALIIVGPLETRRCFINQILVQILVCLNLFQKQKKKKQTCFFFPVSWRISLRLKSRSFLLICSQPSICI